MSHPDDRKRWVLMAALVALSFGINGVCVHGQLGWRGASYATFVPLAAALIYVLITRDRLFGALMLFGLVVGFGELPTDAYDVLGSKTLVYAANEPHIWTSPFYMPFTWIMAITEMGFFAWWATNRWGLVKATIGLTLLGGLYIPGFEIMAKYADFWFYRDSPMLLAAAPYYVILAEAAICGSLPLITLGIEKRRVPMLVVLGLIEAAWIFATTWIFTVLTV